MSSGATRVLVIAAIAAAAGAAAAPTLRQRLPEEGMYPVATGALTLDAGMSPTDRDLVLGAIR